MTPSLDKFQDNPLPGAQPGTVYLVGAGPGDPKLFTIRGVELLQTADVVVFDALANPALLAEARPNATLIDAGKRAKTHKLTQDQINDLLLEHAKAGRSVVRLKGGDPYVFGRGSEEAIYLHQHGVRVETVPGITAAIAAPAYAGIPVTHRAIATTLTLITGHEDPTKPQQQTDYAALAKLALAGGTLCFYMGMGRLQAIADELARHGLDTQTPAAVIQWGTLPTQRSVRAPLKDLPAAAASAGVGSPAIIVVGPVVNADPDGALRFFESRPLFGQTVLITRTRHQASELRQQLATLGANVLEAPTIEIAAPADWADVDRTIREVRSYDWLILTSANGVMALHHRLSTLGFDARHLAGVKIAAIGTATATALASIGIWADLIPTQFVAESLAAELIAREPMAGKKVLMLRADIARPALREKLTEAGAVVQDVSIYQTRPAAGLPDDVLEALRHGKVDWITFTSSSTAKFFAELLGPERGLLAKLKIASIGPITSRTAREIGLNVDVEAQQYDIAGLVTAMVNAIRSGV